MEEDQMQNLPVVDKQKNLVGIPFRVVSEEPRDFWISNYAYYQKQRKDGVKPMPLLGRVTDDNNFQVYNFETGEWETRDLWGEFSYPIYDNSGNPVTNSKGNQRKALYFDRKKEWVIEFEGPTNVEYYSREEKQRVVEKHEKVVARLSKGLSDKLQEELQDPRNNNMTYFVLEKDDNKSPAEMYKVQFHKQG